MQSFEATIVDTQFTLYDKLSDSNKDSDGKGTNERFAETWAAELDDIIPYIEDINKSVLAPPTRLNKFVSYYEKDLGYREEWLWFKDAAIAFRNNVAALMPRIYQIRSTLPCYEVMFAWLGISIALTEDLVYYGGFDNPVLTLDSTVRTFDSYTNALIPIDIALTGPSLTLPFTLPFGIFSYGGFIRAIYTILLFNQPVNVTLRSITYNGTDISADIAAISPNYLRTSF